MDENEQKKKEDTEKLLGLAKDLALFDEIQEMNDSLKDIHETVKTIAEKELPPFPEMPVPFPEMPVFPPFPEIPVTDLTETNDLLKKLVDKKDESIEISLELI